MLISMFNRSVFYRVSPNNILKKRLHFVGAPCIYKDKEPPSALHQKTHKCPKIWETAWPGQKKKKIKVLWENFILWRSELLSYEDRLNSNAADSGLVVGKSKMVIIMTVPSLKMRKIALDNCAGKWCRKCWLKWEYLAEKNGYFYRFH